MRRISHAVGIQWEYRHRKNPSRAVPPGTKHAEDSSGELTSRRDGRTICGRVCMGSAGRNFGIKFYTDCGMEKEIRWVGSAYDDLLAFPAEARQQAGFQLGKVQAGLEPEDWKPFDDIGTGTREIRLRDAGGNFE